MYSHEHHRNDRNDEAMQDIESDEGILTDNVTAKEKE
jgi:hypothetical protein